jgi:hypothetical protein
MRTESPPRWVSVRTMRTSRAGYGRCSGCNEIKHVAADGTVNEHNRYDSEGTSLTTVRCPGSRRPRLDPDEAEIDLVRRRDRPT